MKILNKAQYQIVQDDKIDQCRGIQNFLTCCLPEHILRLSLPTEVSVSRIQHSRKYKATKNSSSHKNEKNLNI